MVKTPWNAGKSVGQKYIAKDFSHEIQVIFTEREAVYVIGNYLDGRTVLPRWGMTIDELEEGYNELKSIAKQSFWKKLFKIK